MRRSNHSNKIRAAGGLLQLAVFLAAASAMAADLVSSNDYYADTSTKLAADEGKPDVPADPSPAATEESHATEPEGSGGAVEGPMMRSGPSFWSKVPPVEPIPRPGLFFVPPTGPGYYWGINAWDGDCQNKPPINPYRTQFFDNDFRYLENPANQQVRLPRPTQANPSRMRLVAFARR